MKNLPPKIGGFIETLNSHSRSRLLQITMALEKQPATGNATISKGKSIATAEGTNPNTCSRCLAAQDSSLLPQGQLVMSAHHPCTKAISSKCSLT